MQSKFVRYKAVADVTAKLIFVTGMFAQYTATWTIKVVQKLQSQRYCKPTAKLVQQRKDRSCVS